MAKLIISLMDVEMTELTQAPVVSVDVPVLTVRAAGRIVILAAIVAILAISVVAAISSIMKQPILMYLDEFYGNPWNNSNVSSVISSFKEPTLSHLNIRDAMLFFHLQSANMEIDYATDVHVHMNYSLGNLIAMLLPLLSLMLLSHYARRWLGELPIAARAMYIGLTSVYYAGLLVWLSRSSSIWLEETADGVDIKLHYFYSAWRTFEYGCLIGLLGAYWGLSTKRRRRTISNPFDTAIRTVRNLWIGASFIVFSAVVFLTISERYYTSEALFTTKSFISSLIASTLAAAYAIALLLAGQLEYSASGRLNDLTNEHFSLIGGLVSNLYQHSDFALFFEMLDKHGADALLKLPLLIPAILLFVIGWKLVQKPGKWKNNILFSVSFALLIMIMAHSSSFGWSAVASIKDQSDKDQSEKSAETYHVNTESVLASALAYGLLFTGAGGVCRSWVSGRMAERRKPL